MPTITTTDWADYQYMRGLDDQDRDDFRFEIVANPEPDQPSDLYFVTVFDWRTGAEIEAFSTSDPGSAVEAAREAQKYTLEERLGPYGIEWEREQRERMCA